MWYGWGDTGNIQYTITQPFIHKSSRNFGFKLKMGLLNQKYSLIIDYQQNASLQGGT